MAERGAKDRFVPKPENVYPEDVASEVGESDGALVSNHRDAFNSGTFDAGFVTGLVKARGTEGARLLIADWLADVNGRAD